MNYWRKGTVVQTELDFAVKPLFNGPGDVLIGNLAVDIMDGIDNPNLIDKVPFDETCYMCNGSGYIHDNDDDCIGFGHRMKCNNCHGRGKVRSIRNIHNAQFSWLYKKLETFILERYGDSKNCPIKHK